jgi:hypothetical protein
LYTAFFEEEGERISVSRKIPYWSRRENFP